MGQTHIKSKVLSIALAFLIAVTMTPCWAIMTAGEVSADTAGKNVAQIGEVGYPTIEAAFEAANAANNPVTIKMLGNPVVNRAAQPPTIDQPALANLNSNVTVNSGKNITLDLNGFGVWAKDKSIIVNGTLTLKDSSEGETGIYGVALKDGVIVNEGGTLNVESGRYYVSYWGLSTESTEAFINNLGTVNISGGSIANIQGNGGWTSSGPVSEASSLGGAGVFNITGGYFGAATNLTGKLGDSCTIETGDFGGYLVGTTNDSPRIEYKQHVVAPAKNYVAQIGDVKYETLADAVSAAQEGDIIEIIKAGNYTPTSFPNNITIKGAVDGVVFDCTGKVTITGDATNTVNFENVKFDWTYKYYDGFQPTGAKVNMKDCTLEGLFFSYGDMNFDGCTFNQTASDYMMWLYAGNISFDGCTFNGNGKFFNVYNEGNGSWTVTANNCHANSTSSNKAVFNIKETCKEKNLKYNVTLSGENTYTGALPKEVTDDDTSVFNSFLMVDDRRVDGTEEGGDIKVKIEEGTTLTENEKPATLTTGEIYRTDKRVSYVAMIGGKGYETLDAAIADAKAATTTEGKTITIVGTVDKAYAFAGDCSGITFLGSETGKVTKGWKVQGSQTNMSNITIDGVKFCEGGNIVFSTAASNYSNLTIQNCVFEGTRADSTPAIQFGTGTAPFDGIKIYNNTISGFSGTSSSAIIFNNDNGHTDSGTVTIEKNTVTDFGHNGVQFILATADLILKDNQFVRNNSKDVLNLSSAKSVTLSENSFTVPGDYSTNNQIVMNDNAGKLIDATDNTFIKGDKTITDIADIAPHIAGYNLSKTFVGYKLKKDESGKLNEGYLCSYGETTEFPTDLIADGYEPVFDNKYGSVYVYQIQEKTAELVAQVIDKEGKPVGENDGKYETLEAAITAVPADGTITMIGDETLTATIKFSKSITFDLNGHTVQGDKTFSLFGISGKDTVFTLKDSGTGGKLTKGKTSNKGNSGDAAIAGGAIFASGATIKIESGIICDNEAADYGGAINLASAKLIMTGGEISGNKAINSGAIALTGVSVAEISGGKICNNTADGQGGAIDLAGGSQLTVSGTAEFSYNSASHGGAIYVEGGSKLTVTGGTFINNDVSYYGGAIRNDGTTEISGGTFNNTSSHRLHVGGDIYNGDAILTITGGTFGSQIAAYGYHQEGAYGTVTIDAAEDGTVPEFNGGLYLWYNQLKDGESQYKILNGKFDGTITNGGHVDAPVFYGGIFTDSMAGWNGSTFTNSNYVAEEYMFVANTDESTMVKYPWKVVKAVASIGTGENIKYYASLREAIAAVQNNETIKILCDIPDAVGMSISNSKTFTIDFDGHTYTVGKPGAGSTGTATQGFQILQGSNVTFKNGTIIVDENNKDVVWLKNAPVKGIAWLINNYGDMTLENMTINGEYLAHNYASAGGQEAAGTPRYVVYNNTGNVTVKNCSIMANKDAGDVAISSNWYGAAYPDHPVVTISGDYKPPHTDGNDTEFPVYGTSIQGKVEAIAGTLNLNDGTKVIGQVRVGENGKDGDKKTPGAEGAIVTIASKTVVERPEYPVVVFGQNTLNVYGEVNSTSETSTDTAAIATNGNAYNAGSIINVYDGATVTSKTCNGIYMPNGTLNISGGVINGKTAVYFKSTNLNITGGTLHATGEKANYNYNGNGGNATGDALVIDSCDYPRGIDSVKVSGGFFNSEKAEAIASYKYDSAQHPRVENFVSGGYFSSNLDSDILAIGCTARATTVQEKENYGSQYTCTIGAEEKYLIETTSAVKNGDTIIPNTVAAVSGGGVYKAGVTATLLAPELDNFEFVGWYTVSSDGEYSGSAVEDNREYTFSVTKSQKYAAVYSPNENKVTVKAKAASTGGGSIEYSEAQDSEGYQTKSETPGTKIEIKAIPENGKQFIYWTDKNGKVLSASDTFEVTAVKNIEVEAVFDDYGAKTVVFNDDSDNLLSAQLIKASEKESISKVVAPSKMGTKFTGWTATEVITITKEDGGQKTYNIGEPLTDDNVAEIIKYAEDNKKVITVKANYVQQNAYTINVYAQFNGGAISETPVVTVTKNIGTSVIITVNKNSNLGVPLKGIYEYNKDSDPSVGAPVSLNNEFTVNPAEEKTYDYVAVYEQAATQNENTATITVNHPLATKSNTEKIDYSFSWSLPKGAILEEVGFNYGLSANGMTYKWRASTEQTVGSAVLHIDIGTTNKLNTPIYVQAIIKYKASPTSESKTLYSGNIGTNIYNAETATLIDSAGSRAGSTDWIGIRDNPYSFNALVQMGKTDGTVNGTSNEGGE